MTPLASTLRLFAVVALTCGGAQIVAAQGSTRSPFLPPQAGGAAAPTQGGPLEYVGYMVTAEGTQYRIYDRARKTGAWIKLNERNPEFEVVGKQYDDNHKTLTIEHQGRTVTLAEREAKVVSAGNAAMAMPPAPINAPPPPANVAPAVTQSVVLNPTPADEQRRLEAVAAEVARRRALREQASQQVNQPQAAGMVPMAPPQPNAAGQPSRMVPQANQRPQR